MVKGRGVDKEECTVTRCVVEEQVNLVSGRGVEQEDYTLTRCVVEEQVNLVSGRGVVQEEYTVTRYVVEEQVISNYVGFMLFFQKCFPAIIFTDVKLVFGFL